MESFFFDWQAAVTLVACLGNLFVKANCSGDGVNQEHQGVDDH